MNVPNDEIAEEIAHQQQMVQAFNARRRVLDLQAAQFGIEAPPHIVTELAKLTEEIKTREDQIAHLKSRTAAAHVPVEEIEYQAMLAEEWHNSAGRLNLAQRTRLDWTRVRLGIALDRAQVMEHAVRVQLAEEVFDDLNFNYLPHNYANEPPPPAAFRFDRLRKAIQLDLPTAARLFYARLALVRFFDRSEVEAQLLDPHAACRQDDIERYSRFIRDVSTLRAKAEGVNR